MSIFFEFQTPTGETTKLNYLQQCIVRSTNFKRWFGDWQTEAKMLGTKQITNFNILEKYNKNTSKAIDIDTLEPQVFFHGTIVDDQFFEFDTTQKTPNYIMGMAFKKDLMVILQQIKNIQKILVIDQLEQNNLSYMMFFYKH